MFPNIIHVLWYGWPLSFVRCMFARLNSNDVDESAPFDYYYYNKNGYSLYFIHSDFKLQIA